MAKKEEKQEHDHKHEIDMEEQRRALEQQMMQQQLVEIESQLNQIEAKKIELQSIQESIEELSKHKDKDMLVPVGSGILAKSKLTDGKEFLVNVGANIILKKDSKETVDIIEVQIKELDKAKEMFQQELQKILGLQNP